MGEALTQSLNLINAKLWNQSPNIEGTPRLKITGKTHTIIEFEVVQDINDLTVVTVFIKKADPPPLPESKAGYLKSSNLNGDCVHDGNDSCWNQAQIANSPTESNESNVLANIASMQSTAAPDLTNELDSEVDKYEYIENGNLRIAVNNTDNVSTAEESVIRGKSGQIEDVIRKIKTDKRVEAFPSLSAADSESLLHPQKDDEALNETDGSVSYLGLEDVAEEHQKMLEYDQNRTCDTPIAGSEVLSGSAVTGLKEAVSLFITRNLLPIVTARKRREQFTEEDKALWEQIAALVPAKFEDATLPPKKRGRRGESRTNGKKKQQTFTPRNRVTDKVIKESKQSAEVVQCPYCDEQLHSRLAFKKHCIRRHERKRFTCAICQLEGPVRYERHLLTHGDKNKERCVLCNEWFASRDSLHEHWKAVHPDSKSFICLVCNKALGSEEKFQKHMVTHAAPNRSYCCHICGDQFKNNRNLNVHITGAHDGVRPYSCLKCGRNFAEEVALRRHELTHSKDRPHMCSVCGVRFKTQGAAKTHERNIHGEMRPRPFNCNMCSKGFMLEVHLKKHQTVHTGEKPWCCSLCGAKFASKGDLKRHTETIHEGRRDFECPQCRKKFTTSGALNRHSLIHSGKKPHACAVCKTKFRTSGDLRRHMRNVHNIEEEHSGKRDMPQKGPYKKKASTGANTIVHVQATTATEDDSQTSADPTATQCPSLQRCPVTLSADMTQQETHYECQQQVTGDNLQSNMVNQASVAEFMAVMKPDSNLQCANTYPMVDSGVYSMNTVKENGPWTNSDVDSVSQPASIPESCENSQAVHPLSQRSIQSSEAGETQALMQNQWRVSIDQSRDLVQTDMQQAPHIASPSSIPIFSGQTTSAQTPSICQSSVSNFDLAMSALHAVVTNNTNGGLPRLDWQPVNFDVGRGGNQLDFGGEHDRVLPQHTGVSTKRDEWNQQQSTSGASQ